MTRLIGNYLEATWGLKYWTVWLIAVATTFVIPEAVALATNPANTLSDYAWRELGLPQNGGPILYTAAWYFSLAAYIVLVVFLAIHIWFVKLR